MSEGMNDLKRRALLLTTPEHVADLEREKLLWWFVAHQEPDPNKRPPISADNFESGWFMISTGAHGPRIPATIRWNPDTQSWSATRGFRPLQPFDLSEVAKTWTWIAKKPISYERYAAALEAGDWPEHAEQSRIGDNNPPPEGYEAIRDAIAQMEAEALAWFKAFEVKAPNGSVVTTLPDEAAANRAMKWREDLLKLHKLADDTRIAEKAPHKTAADAVDAKWMDSCVKKAKAAADKLHAAWKAWGDKERKAREKAALDAIAANKPIESVKAVEPVRYQGAGRATPLRTKRVCVVEDHAKALEFLKDRDEIKAAVARLCQAIFEEKGTLVPGTKEERIAA